MLETPVYLVVPACCAASVEHRRGNNPSSADNQQERLLKMISYDPGKVSPDIGYYLAGFADGEGSFNVSFRKRKDYEMPWKISLCFNVSQRDKVILSLFKRHLKCGTMRTRTDGVWYYEVNNFNAINEHVIPFFNRFRFLSAKKKRDFAKFKELAGLLEKGQHLHESGIRKILQVRSEMNDGGAGRRKYSDDEILAVFRSGESSETIRRAASK